MKSRQRSAVKRLRTFRTSALLALIGIRRPFEFRLHRLDAPGIPELTCNISRKSSENAFATWTYCGDVLYVLGCARTAAESSPTPLLRIPLSMQTARLLHSVAQMGPLGIYIDNADGT